MRAGCSAVVLLAAIACSAEPATDAGRSAADDDGDSTGRAFAPAGLHFDPRTTRKGTAFGALRLDSIEVRTAIDSTAVGSARFSGDLEVRGWRVDHPDPDPGPECFEVDDVSARRLPRWQGDERRPWFCFENAGEARRLLARADSLDTLVISIDRFTIQRGLSDEVNSARLRALLQVGGGADLIDGTVRVVTADDPRWSIMREASADLDGDGRAERVLLISNVSVQGGRPLWEDGHHWQLYVEDPAGVRTYLYSRFVPNGVVDVSLTEPDGGGMRRLVVLERSPFALRAYEIQYAGDGRVTSRERFDYRTDPSHGFSGIPY